MLIFNILDLFHNFAVAKHKEKTAYSCGPITDIVRNNHIVHR